MKATKKELTWTVILVLALVLFFATGCKTVYVPVERTEVEYRDRYRIDSIYNRDTVELYRQNDTIYKNVIRWRERFTLDTLYIHKIDSIPIIKEVEKIIEVNKLTWWQSFRLKSFNVILIIAGVLLLIFFIRK